MPRPKMTDEKIIATTVRIPVSFHNILMDEAQRSNRSLNQEILYLLHRALAAGFGEPSSRAVKSDHPD